MKDCCGEKATELSHLRKTQGRVLKVVLVINLLMFFVEIVAGIKARSTSLLADSLDMLGDSIVYAFSLYVLNRGPRWQAAASLMKGLGMLAFGIGILTDAVLKTFKGIVPIPQIMGIVGLVALFANVSCALLLLRYRHDDINMRSTWLCSRNDVLANTGVLIAALGVHLTGTIWPDVLVGTAIAVVVLLSSISTLTESSAELRTK